MTNPVELSLLQCQKVILKFATDPNSNYKHFIYSAGLGSGKTRLLCIFTYLQCLKHHGGTHIIIGPDYPYLKMELLPRFKEILDDLGLRNYIHYKINHTDFSIHFVFGATVIFKTAKSGIEAFRGFNAKSIAIDEIGDIDDAIVSEAFNRLRGESPAGPLCSLRVGCPQFNTTGLHWQICTDPTLTPVGSYEVGGRTFTRLKVDPKHGLMIMFGSSHENVDILGYDYIDNLGHRFGHSQEVYDNQCHGLFKATSLKSIFSYDPVRNLVYDHEIHSDVREVLISIDFNVGKCTGLIGYIKEGKVIVSDMTRGKDTEDLILNIFKIIPASEFCWHSIRITGDAAGYHQSTRGGYGKCDWDLVEELFGINFFNFKIVAPKYNPSISTSIVNVNRHLSRNIITGTDETLRVNSTCVDLIQSLQFAESDGHGRIIKKGAKDKYSHPADALRYLIELVSPSSSREFGDL